MRTLIVYESMYGNTHTIAERIADGLRDEHDVVVVPAHEATQALIDGVDLVVVGGPTHVHSMSTTQSRSSAKDRVEKSPGTLTLDPDAESMGLRDWFDGLHDVEGKAAAAFDTRTDAPPLLTGRASKGIAHRLRRHGFRLVREPESFLVDSSTHLLVHEDDRARAWGASLAAAFSAAH